MLLVLVLVLMLVVLLVMVQGVLGGRRGSMGGTALDISPGSVRVVGQAGSSRVWLAGREWVEI